MKVIEGKLSQEVLDIVEPFATWFFEQDQDLINIHGKADKDEYYTDNEYLDYIEAKGHEGFPEEKYGIDLTDIKSTPLEYRDKIIDVTKQLNNFFGSQFNAVKMYYPKDGFMSWHNNHNVPGYNILMSYTKNGDGWFRYKDPITEEIITLYDKPGWTAKVGYYGHNEEPDKLYWHCARAYEPRLTLGFVIPNEEMWEMMCEDLTPNDV
jgi:hypothetical protein